MPRYPLDMHDLVIKNAILVDGVGTPPRGGELAVKDGRIAAIGRDVGAARQTVDADGLTLAPGIIDGHTHYDAQLTWDPYADPSPAHGVTTVVIGNCGFTIAPCRAADRDLTMRNLTHVEGMSIEALRSGIDWGFESFADYMDMLTRRGVGPNVAAFIGHSSVRTYVMGDAAAKRAATDAEIEAMQSLVRGAMAAGAVGFATSTSEAHNGELGIPMPSRLADEREQRALVHAMAEGGRGLFMLTRGSTTSIPYLESLAAETGRPVLIAALFYNQLDPDAVFKRIDEIRAARSRGRRLIGQVSCCPLTMEFTLQSPYVFESLPAWKPAMEAHGEALTQVYRDERFRETVKADIDRRRGRLFNGEWDKLHVVEAATSDLRGREGKSVAELAAADRRHPLDWFLDFGLADKLETLFTAELLNADPGGVGRLITDPETHVSLSDAGAHLTFLCDVGFGLRLIGHWARDQGVLSIPEAVRRLTSQPAAIFGITDRGRLAPGLAADLMLFDPGEIGRGPPRRVHDLPAGAARLVTEPCGLHGVWINGTRVADRAGMIADGKTPGVVLRNFAA
ncbi:MAG TPA: amidohydrolase family protein [Alphaproteobacteria bacterium]